MWGRDGDWVVDKETNRNAGEIIIEITAPAEHRAMEIGPITRAESASSSAGGAALLLQQRRGSDSISAFISQRTASNDAISSDPSATSHCTASPR